MDNISYEFIDVEIPDFRSEFFDLWLVKVIKSYKMNLGSLSYIFVNDEYLLEINRDQLNHDYYTDIITFNYNEKDSLMGEIFVSLDRVKSNAIEFGNGSFHDELCRVMVHGILHLIGFDDKTNAGKVEMRREEERCLNLR